MDQFKEKPQLLHAIEMMLSPTEEIKLEAMKYRSRYRLRYQNTKSDAEIRRIAAKAIVDDFSNKSALSGGATALTGIVPGIGTVIAALGGTLADTALSLKFDVEMILHIATLYDLDIDQEAVRQECFVVAGLGVLVDSEGGGVDELLKQVKAALVRSDANLVAGIFRTVGLQMAKRAVGKAIPLGIGVVLSASANKKLGYTLGKNAVTYYEDKLKTEE